ncbi:hypothetical protein FRC03_007666 [Tulasnella sp. 419]|nr:hypothetical protein FRC03_007666 [Tulasnella sp. 419]
MNTNSSLRTQATPPMARGLFASWATGPRPLKSMAINTFQPEHDHLYVNEARYPSIKKAFVTFKNYGGNACGDSKGPLRILDPRDVRICDREAFELVEIDQRLKLTFRNYGGFYDCNEEIYYSEGTLEGCTMVQLYLK